MALDAQTLLRGLEQTLDNKPAFSETDELSRPQLQWIGICSALLNEVDIGLAVSFDMQTNRLTRGDWAAGKNEMLAIVHKAAERVRLRLFPANGYQTDGASFWQSAQPRPMRAATHSEIIEPPPMPSPPIPNMAGETRSDSGEAVLSAKAFGDAGIIKSASTVPAIVSAIATAAGTSTANATATSDNSEEALVLEKLLARVAILEAAITQVRSVSASGPEINGSGARFGIGHNNPPPPASDSELAEIDEFILNLRDLSPRPNDKILAVIARSERVSVIGAKILCYADTIATEACRSFGAEAGKRLAQLPFWLALSAAASSVLAALKQLAETLF